MQAVSGIVSQGDFLKKRIVKQLYRPFAAGFNLASESSENTN
jgi:hypothetical protein